MYISFKFFDSTSIYSVVWRALVGLAWDRNWICLHVLYLGQGQCKCELSLTAEDFVVVLVNHAISIITSRLR